MIVTSEDICKLIEKLKCGKASGPDGISAESLSFAHDSLHVLLSLCFSACLSHSFLPLTFAPLIRKIRRIRPYLTDYAVRTLVQTTVTVRLDYCNSLYNGLTVGTMKKLQIAQNAAARLIIVVL